MAIEWDVLVVEMSLLAGIIYGAIYVEGWVEKRKVRSEEKEMKKKILMIVANDLNKQLQFIEKCSPPIGSISQTTAWKKF